MPQNVYYIRFDNTDGNDQSLLVSAPTGEDATAIWRKAHSLDLTDIPMWVGQLPGVTAVGDPMPFGLDIVERQTLTPRPTPHVFSLFFIRSELDGEGNKDLYVRAYDEAQAESLWRAHYPIECGSKPDWVGMVPCVIPTGEPGAIPWESINPE